MPDGLHVISAVLTWPGRVDVIAAPLASCLAPPGKTYYAHPAPWGQSSCPRSTGFR